MKLNWKERCNLEKMYYDLVLAHKRTCNKNNKTVKQVPHTYLDIVLQMLTENGYDADGNKVSE